MQTQDLSNKKQSHGLTHQQMADLKHAQVNREAKKIKANKDSSVEIPEVETHLVHARIESPQFDSKTGKKQSVPKIQVFYPEEFEAAIKSGAFVDMTVDIVHLPTKTADGGKINVDLDKAQEQLKPANKEATPDAEEEHDEISKMTVKELQDHYFEITGEEAPANLKKAELAAKVREALQ